MSDTQQGAADQSKWPLWISVSIIAILAGCYFLIPSFNDSVSEAFNILTSGDKQRISEWVEKLGFWGPLFIIVAMVAQMFLLVIPSPLLIVVSVIAYGSVRGSILAIVSIFVASSVGYWIGRYLGTVSVDRLIGHKKEQKLEYYMNRFGFWAVFITRLTPFLSNDAISFVGGILRMGYWKFIGATLAGITPLVVLIAYFGESNERLKNGLLWISGISLVIFIFYVVYDRKKKPEKKMQE